MTRARWLSFFWSRERQEIMVDGEAFAHSTTTPTSPAHDLAHLIAAAAGLPWKPRGTRDQICFAEHAAIFLENLAVNAFDAVHCGGNNDVLDRTVEHARWFVEQHYAPFPSSAEVALARVRDDADLEVIVGLSPIFFRLRAYELAHSDFRERTFGARFSSAFRSPIDDVSRGPQRVLAAQLVALRERSVGAAKSLSPDRLKC